MTAVAKVLLVPAVAALLVAGIWVTGGLLTNEFRLAMALTAVWMAAAGVVCVLVAWRHPQLRLPLLGTYLLVAALAGVYLGRSQLVDDVVDEQVVEASPTTKLLARGDFEAVAHSAQGTARVIRTRDRRVLTLTGFEVSNGPDLRLYVVEGPARSEEDVHEFTDLGSLKGNKGDQQYELPRSIDLDRPHTVVVWCRAFSVNFARAPLT